MPFTSVSVQMTNALAGNLVDNDHASLASYINAEASAHIPFGTMMVQGTLDKDALLPNTSTAAAAPKMIGIVVRSQAYERAQEIDATGLLPGVELQILKRGKVYVVSEEDVTPASAVRVRVLTGTGTVIGGFRTSADASKCVDISKYARYLNTATAGTPVAVEIDMTMRFNGVAD